MALGDEDAPGVEFLTVYAARLVSSLHCVVGGDSGSQAVLAMEKSVMAALKAACRSTADQRLPVRS